jgi:N utilization substance protein B
MSTFQKKINPQHARRRARRSALQALYQWQLSDTSLGEIEQQFLKEQEMQLVDLNYFHELLHEIPAHLDELDEIILPYVEEGVERIDPVERAILRIGAYEFKFRPDIPYRVVLDEAISLAKNFGAVEGHKYINAVLDKAAQQLRSIEIKAGM